MNEDKISTILSKIITWMKTFHLNPTIPIEYLLQIKNLDLGFLAEITPQILKEEMELGISNRNIIDCIRFDVISKVLNDEKLKLTDFEQFLIDYREGFWETWGEYL